MELIDPEFIEKAEEKPKTLYIKVTTKSTIYCTTNIP